MNQTFKRTVQKGFTLVELLIVVIILAILAAIVVPQFSSSTTDANNAAVQTNLAAMRSAIELYAAQHNGKYPGAVQTDGTSASTAATVSAAFLAQMTLPSDSTGKTNATKTAAFPLGPYIRGAALPPDPTSTTSTITAKNDMTGAIAGTALVSSTGALVTSAATAYSYDATSGQIVSATNPKY